MQITRVIAVALIGTILTTAAAMGFEPMNATIRVSNGALYDYVIIGEHALATDGYDNTYDTISPGNLNADMGEPFISAVLLHPDWKPGTRGLRGDIRALAVHQKWELTVRSSLTKGTPLTIGIVPERTTLPKGVKLTLRHEAQKKEINLTSGSIEIPAPGQGNSLQLFVIAEIR